jgi:hypothetical protein
MRSFLSTWSTFEILLPAVLEGHLDWMWQAKVHIFIEYAIVFESAVSARQGQIGDRMLEGAAQWLT